MSKTEVAGLKVGSKIRDLIGNTLVVTAIDDDRILHTLKYLHDDGSFGKGAVIAVPSHLEWDTLISY